MSCGSPPRTSTSRSSRRRWRARTGFLGPANLLEPTALSLSELDQIASDLDAALDLWRGDAYADLADADAAVAERVRLSELRTVALEDRAVVALHLGEHATVAAELEVLTAGHPLRERLWALRALALTRSGRPGGCPRGAGARSRRPRRGTRSRAISRGAPVAVAGSAPGRAAALAAAGGGQAAFSGDGCPPGPAGGGIGGAARARGRAAWGGTRWPSGLGRASGRSVTPRAGGRSVTRTTRWPSGLGRASMSIRHPPGRGAIRHRPGKRAMRLPNTITIRRRRRRPNSRPRPPPRRRRHRLAAGRTRSRERPGR